MKSITNPLAFRNKVVEQFKQKGITNETFAKNMEISLYNYTIQEATIRLVVKSWDNPYFIVIYVNHLKSILVNLTEEILQKIMSGEIKPQNIAFMTHQELNYGKWKQLLEEKAKQDKYKFEEKVQASTDTFVCKKCKKNICSYYQLQTRSSDESITTFITCLTCEYRWKE